jgi:hypothetical protein
MIRRIVGLYYQETFRIFKIILDSPQHFKQIRMLRYTTLEVTTTAKSRGKYLGETWEGEAAQVATRLKRYAEDSWWWLRTTYTTLTISPSSFIKLQKIISRIPPLRGSYLWKQMTWHSTLIFLLGISTLPLPGECFCP